LSLVKTKKNDKYLNFFMIDLFNFTQEFVSIDLFNFTFKICLNKEKQNLIK